jgi:hypothetical protein
MWQHFDGKVAHSILAIVLLYLALNHNVEMSKEQLVEKNIHLMLIFTVISHFFKFLCRHAHYRVAMLPCKVNKYTVGNI